MTREELKEHCKKQIEICEMWAKAKGENPCGKVYEEHKLILELLEQESCKDCISREEAKQFLYERLDRLNNDELYDIFSKIIDDMYNELQPVTPQPKIGHWIDDKCSACGKGIEDLIDSREWYRNEKPNFCPFCGVKMVDSQESEG